MIRRVAKSCGLKSVLSVTSNVAAQRLLRAEQTYKRLKKSAYRLRHEFLCNREDLAQSIKSKMEICEIRQHEETWRSWRTINRSYGKAREKESPKLIYKRMENGLQSLRVMR